MAELAEQNVELCTTVTTHKIRFRTAENSSSATGYEGSSTCPPASSSRYERLVDTFLCSMLCFLELGGTKLLPKRFWDGFQ